MFKKIKTYRVSITTHMDKIFPNGLPVNAFIDKGRCGIGGTTREVKDKSRTTILTVPNISILIDKLNAEELDERPDYIIYGDIKYREVKEIVQKVKLGDKIMTTPEGIRKIMKAAKQTGRLEEAYQEWFLLLDECHTFITEEYRDDILAPFDYFWDFKQKSIISATPYYFSDERFYEELELHKIEFTKTLNTVTLINSISVEATLNYILQNADYIPNNLHIFYNSVTAIRNVIARSQITDFNIFCADSDKNRETLGDLVSFFAERPLAKNFKKANFYTSKYFEGWDLHDENATLILVTDFRNPHTAVGITNKGKQALGRARKPVHRLIHITNHKCVSSRKPLSDCIAQNTTDALKIIELHHEYIKDNRTTRFGDDGRLKFFADVDDESKKASLNKNKLDQQINQEFLAQSYQHLKFIKEDWEGAYFDVNLKHHKLTLETKTATKRKSKATRIKEDYQALKEYYESEELLFSIGKSVPEIIAERNPTAYQAFHNLREEELKKVNYNPKKIEKALILKGNDLQHIQLAKLLKRTFEIKTFYTNDEVSNKLQSFYNKLNILNPKTGKIRKASPRQLEEPGLFNIRETKRKQSDGIIKNGIFIIDYKLGLRVTE